MACVSSSFFVFTSFVYYFVFTQFFLMIFPVVLFTFLLHLYLQLIAIDGVDKSALNELPTKEYTLCDEEGKRARKHCTWTCRYKYGLRNQRFHIFAVVLDGFCSSHKIGDKRNLNNSMLRFEVHQIDGFSIGLVSDADSSWL